MKIILTANTDWYLYNFRSSLIDQLIDGGNQVILSSPDGSFVPEFRAKDIEWHEWPVGRQTISPFSEIPSILKLTRIYKDIRPDLVHHHTLKGIIYGSIAARLAGVPHVVNSVAGRGLVYASNDLKSRLLRVVVNFLLRISNRRGATHWIFENSEDQSAFLQSEILSSQSCSLIRSVGVDLDRFIYTPQPEEPIRVLFVGRLLKLKGILEFIEAARQIKKSYDVEFVIAGTPDQGNPDSISQEQLDQWIKEGIITYAGWQAAIEQVYQSCHIVVFPTRYGEGVPTVLLEAAASGRPVIASDHPGCLAVIENQINGLIINPKDQEQIQSAIRQLIGDSDLRQRYGKKAREMIIGPFSKKNINAETILIYDALMENNQDA